MRNEPLHAYSLHQRPFQDKRSIYYLLTQEYGVLHGVAQKGIPQFVPLMLFATGKKSLKTLQSVNITETVPSLIGQQQYAALYVNEITLKLLPVEDSVPSVYQQYSVTMRRLQEPLSRDELKLVLRHYEHVLFAELGFAIDLEQDNQQSSIKPDQWYAFGADNGWTLLSSTSAEDTDSGAAGLQATSQNSLKAPRLLGESIIAMRSGIDSQTLTHWSLVHRQLIDHLFDYQPLQSRILWQQFYRYQ